MIMLDFKSAAKITGVNTSYVIDKKRKLDNIQVGRELSETINSASIIFFRRRI